MCDTTPALIASITKYRNRGRPPPAIDIDIDIDFDTALFDRTIDFGVRSIVKSF